MEFSLITSYLASIWRLRHQYTGEHTDVATHVLVVMFATTWLQISGDVEKTALFCPLSIAAIHVLGSVVFILSKKRHFTAIGNRGIAEPIVVSSAAVAALVLNYLASTFMATSVFYFAVHLCRSLGVRYDTQTQQHDIEIEKHMRDAKDAGDVENTGGAEDDVRPLEGNPMPLERR